MKKMIKIIFVSIAWLSAIYASAHQPDISSLTLVEQQPSQWVLQMNASMTAFQYEVRNAYGEDSYASPEEFNQLLLQYLRAQMVIQVNGEEVTLGNGWVQLGHATTVAFELSEVPEVIETVFVNNEAFKNIRDSQVIFGIIIDGFEKSHFVLSNANDYQLHVSLTENQVLLAKIPWKGNRTLTAFIIILTGLIGFLFYNTRLKKRTLVQELD
ncbi:MAG: DUF6702 family protein [Cyclobacteriaceae bacterium]